MSRSRIRRTVLAVSLLGLALAPASHATKGGPINYPKIATYVYRVGQFTEAQRETLSWSDLVTCRERPDVIADMRARNPHQILLHRSMPQNIEGGGEGQTYWYPDTAWCLMSLCKFYAMQNDWYLYDTSGQPIEEWSGYAANWTRYCPRGTYGTSRGMTYAEWYINVALPQIAYHSSAWERWGYGSSSYDGIAWETFFDCPACCVSGQYRYADPDRDGIAEGIEGTCWDGGYEDSLSILYRETNVAFREAMLRVLEPDLIVNINRGGYQLNPEWAWELNGLKLEDWRPSRTNPVKSWWSWMYGRRSPYMYYGDGYQFAERYMHPTGIDERDGWDMTWLMLWTRGESWPASYRNRMQRWGLGTTMLGDGYFIFTVDQHYPTWLASYDADFGEPLEDYQKELHGADTLYVRRFARGFVEVNPYDHEVNSLNAEDARFAFWLPLTDLSVETVGVDQVTLSWVVPAGWEYTFDRTEVRYATVPITAETWEAATPAPAGPTTGNPGERIEYTVTGLEPRTDYYFAARNTIYWRPEPEISNVVLATTGASGDEDVTPPGAITDLASTDVGASWARIAWTATGDDGLEGAADHYLVRYLTGRAISTESDWARAVPVSGAIPAPGSPGTAQSMRVDGLGASMPYGLAVRVVDDADLISGISNALVVTTDPPGDGTPPAPIPDLGADSTHVDGFTLAWTATGDDGTQGRAASYILGYLPGQGITTEGAWTVAQKVTDGLPVPATAGTPETYRLRGLAPGTIYGLAMRARDDAGHLSALGASPLLSTTPIELPDTIPPAPITALTALGVGTRSVDLRWACTGDDSLTGRSARFVLGYLAGAELGDEAAWDRAQKVEEGLPEPQNPGQNVVYTLPGLAPEQTYAIAVRAYDDAEMLSALGAVVVATTAALPDTVPPDGLTDLQSPEQGMQWIELAWSAVGDDGDSGRAHHYELRYLAGRAIDDESDWSAALRAEDELPVPGEPGAAEGARLNGLEASTSYGIALRAYDEAGHRSALSNPLLVKTADVPDEWPPSAVGGLEIEGRYPDGFDLGWIAPGDDGTEGTASFYILGYGEGIAIDSEPRWATAVRETLETPPPAVAGTRQHYRVTGLLPETTYGLAVRAVDDAGMIGPLPSPLIDTTPAIPVPPDTLPPASIADLTLISRTPTTLRLGWSAPGDDGDEGRAEQFAIAWTASAEPIDSEADWDAAEHRSEGLPAPPEPGAAVEVELDGLAAGTTYAIAVRAFDDAGLAGGLSNPLVATTAPAPDDVPPAAIPDLAARDVGETWVTLSWSSPGDDGWIGTAERFILAWSDGEALTSETAWERAAQVTEGLPVPGDPATGVEYTLGALAAGHGYSVAVRAVDDAGWMSPLGPAANFETLAAADELPPGRVSDLTAVLLAADAVRLSWTAAGDDGASGTAARLVVARRADQTITTEEEWAAARLDTLENLVPGGALDTLRVAGLEPDRTWGFALRYSDETGARGEISNFATVEVPAAPGEIDSIPPGPVADLHVAAMEPAALTLCWTPAGDDSTAGEAAGYVVGVLPGARIDAANWEEAALASIDATLGERGTLECHGVAGLTAGASYGLAVRAIDEEGNLSEIGDRLWVPRHVPGPVTPPEVVADLRAAATGGDWVELAWSAPEGGGSTAEAYEIAWDEAPPIDAEWSTSYHWRPANAPGAAHQPETVRLASLGADRSYWIALRTRNGLGRWSEFSAPLQARTVPRDVAAPAAPNAPTVTIDAEAWVAHLSWPAAPELDVVGYHVYGRAPDATQRERLTETPVVETRWWFAVSAGGANLYVSVAAVDASGNVSAPGAETALFEETARLAGPFPHPIEDEARFELTLPPRPEGHARVTGKIYTVAGAPVRRWIDEDLATGPEHELRWDTRSDDGAWVAPGLYFLRIDVADQTLIRKIYVGR